WPHPRPRRYSAIGGLAASELSKVRGRFTLPGAMTSGILRFEGFELDPGNRRLCRDGEPVELTARYLDALMLLASEQGRLVTKERFHEEVWRGIPVTDEALTQCIATLRRQLGDAAGKPRFIETVPKHGYRFIAPVELDDGGAPAVRTVD